VNYHIPKDAELMMGRLRDQLKARAATLAPKDVDLILDLAQSAIRMSVSYGQDGDDEATISKGGYTVTVGGGEFLMVQRTILTIGLDS
jgi:hypothetical protein